jgi:hypothetical protein
LRVTAQGCSTLPLWPSATQDLRASVDRPHYRSAVFNTLEQGRSECAPAAVASCGGFFMEDSFREGMPTRFQSVTLADGFARLNESGVASAEALQNLKIIAETDSEEVLMNQFASLAHIVAKPVRPITRTLQTFSASQSKMHQVR